MYQFSLDLGHATSYFISLPGPNDGAILALDGDDLIAMNGATLGALIVSQAFLGKLYVHSACPVRV